jgi:DNA-binding CsgD family transcriptional regulator
LCHLDARRALRGSGNQVGAARWQITYQTARTHQRNIRQKLDAHSAAKVLQTARQTGVY